MKIQLISPKAEAMFNHLNFYRCEGTVFFAPPGGLAAIAALTPKGVDVEIIDENIDKLEFDDDVDLVGIGIANSYMALRAYKIAKIYRQRGVTVVFGGIHTTLFQDECLKYADAIVVGEAEDIWAEVILDFKRHKLRRVYKCKKRPELKNRPMPRWDLLKINSYDVVSVNATRGCPHNCNFCLIKTHMGNKLRHKPVEDVVKEVMFIKKNFKHKKIWFVDPNFTANRKYAKALITELIPLDIRYYCFANIDVYKDKGLLELLAKSGCFALSVGMESLGYNNLSDGNKEKINNVEEYTRAIDEIRSYGIELICNFMVGNTFDNEKTFEDLAKFIDQNNILFPCIFPASICPRIPWYKKLEKDIDATLNEFNFFNYVILNPNSIGKSEFWFHYARLFHDVYSYKSVFKRKLRLMKKLRRDCKMSMPISHSSYFFFKSLPDLFKRIQKASKIAIETRSIWGGCVAFFYPNEIPFFAWQQISCSKNFLIAYCNINLDMYSKMPGPSMGDDLLLKTVTKLIQKQSIGKPSLKK